MKYKITDQFYLKQQFEQYCWVGYNKASDQLNPKQMREIRRAFIFAWGQCILVNRDYVSAFEDDNKCVAILEDMLKQVTNFLLEEQNRNQ
jgi:hypothetical protein